MLWVLCVVFFSPTENAGQVVSHPVALRPQIGDVVVVRNHFDPTAVSNLGDQTGKGIDFLGIVGHQIDRTDTQVCKDVACCGIVACVDWQALFKVCINGVEPVVLSTVGAQLGE